MDKLPNISPRRVSSLELDVGEAEDDDTYDPSEHDFESGYDEDGFNHTLTSICSGLCGAGAVGYYGCHLVSINLTKEYTT